MKAKLVLATALCALCLGSAPSWAEGFNLEGWQLRVRAIDVVPDEDSTLSIGGRASIDTQVVPELDISYFFTPNIAAELILAVTPHDVNALGTGLGDVDLGDVWLLPPTLTLQYHFTNFGQFKPYVGAGVNYTVFFNEDPGAVNSTDYDNSFGAAFQAGFDYMLDDHWMLNADVKKVMINTDVSINGGAITGDVDIDPWIFGLGFGYRF